MGLMRVRGRRGKGVEIEKELNKVRNAVVRDLVYVNEDIEDC